MTLTTTPQPPKRQAVDDPRAEPGGHPAWVEVPTAKARMRSDGILEVRCKPNAVETLESARSNLAIGQRLAADKAPCPMLLVFGALKNLTREAQGFYSTDPEVPRVVSRLAIVVDSPVSQVLGNIFLGIGRPAMAVKLFTNDGKALAWLKQK